MYSTKLSRYFVFDTLKVDLISSMDIVDQVSDVLPWPIVCNDTICGRSVN